MRSSTGIVLPITRCRLCNDLLHLACIFPIDKCNSLIGSQPHSPFATQLFMGDNPLAKKLTNANIYEEGGAIVQDHVSAIRAVKSLGLQTYKIANLESCLLGF